MLDLPVNWQACSTGYVVRCLLRQADALGQYEAAARAMAFASLEFMLSGPRWTSQVDGAALTPHSSGWRINNWLFYVPPRIDDDLLDEIATLTSSQCSVDLIVPPWATQLARNAVAALSRNRRVIVSSVDSYIDLRILLTSLDLGAPHCDALIDFLRRYQRLVRDAPAVLVNAIQNE
jgi:hypothetical protein